MPKKKMTLDKLARITLNQFSKLDKKFEKKFDGLEYKVDHTKMKVEHIDKKLDDALARQDNQDTQLKNHEERIVVLERKNGLKV